MIQALPLRLLSVLLFIGISVSFRSVQYSLLKSGLQKKWSKNWKHKKLSDTTRLTPLRSSLTNSGRKKQLFHDLLYQPPSYIIDIADNQPSKRLTIADVAALSGVSFSTAKRDIMILAYLTQATIQVSQDGVLYFQFPEKVKELVRKRSSRYNLQKNFDTYIFPILNQAIRVSVGGFLLLSVALVAITLATASASMTYESSSSRSSRSRRDEDDRDQRRRSSSARSSRNGRSSSPVNIHFFFDLSDILTLFARQYQHQAWLDRYRQYSEGRSDQLEVNLNFLEACFSFLFGDGDPNRDYEERLSIAAAKYIRKQQGIVIAEELIPFLSEPPPYRQKLKTNRIVGGGNDEEEDSKDSEGSDLTTIDESYILPLLIKYNGSPVVTEDGTILYRFEELLLSGDHSSRRQTAVISSNPFLHDFVRKPTTELLNTHDLHSELETSIPFSLAKPYQLVMVGSLGLVNFIGVAVLGNLLRANTATRSVILSQFPGSLLARCYPLFWLYSVSFVGIPLIRGVYNAIKNRKIRQRNEQKSQWFQSLKNWRKNRELKKKLQHRNDYLYEQNIVQREAESQSDNEIVYTTSEDLLEQRFRKLEKDKQ